MDRVHNIKQVIVLRKDLNMRKGKMAAQASHASIAAIFPRENTTVLNVNEKTIDCKMTLTDDQYKWFTNFSKKVVVGVDGENELLEIYKKAKDMGLPCSLIQDAGFTEFNGVPTYTAVGVGPARDEKIDLITGDLKLL